MDISENIRRLVADFGIEACAINRLRIGRNSRVWEVFDKKTKYVVKEYGHRDLGTRNRLESEFTFLEFLNLYEINNVPVPLHKNIEKNTGIYSFIEALPVRKVTAPLVRECAQFIYEINEIRERQEASELANAAEACFSIQEHLDCVTSRMKVLSGIGEDSEEHRKANEFVHNDLYSKYDLHVNRIHSTLSSTEINRGLDNDERIISPSDFGFHNTLVSGERVYFLDFEYAGWDDPAKLLCDFSYQPNISISLRDQYVFKSRINELMYMPEAMGRASLLGPLYKIKWCCILLNEFLEDGYRRRKHALGPDGSLLKTQLRKTIDYFAVNLGEV